MPWPASVSMQSGSVPITGEFTISLSGAGSKDPRVAPYVTRIPARVTAETGIPFFVKPLADSQAATLRITVDAVDHPAPQRLGDDESYTLTVEEGHVLLSAKNPLGALRGIETFLQLIQQNPSGTPGYSVPSVHIDDKPRFPWRGLSLDVSRHFIPLDEVRRTLDGMASVKLNVFHWHLSDDQGIRVESKRFPRLQKLSSDGLFYTQAEIRDTIAYARERGIRVVPEFDMPGHVASWFAAYPQFASGPGPYTITRGSGVFAALMDPTNEQLYPFLDGFIGEMSALFPDEYFHIGGDEVDPKQWNDNPKIQTYMKQHKIADDKALQAYFNRRLLKIVTAHHKHMEGWDEILHPDLPKTIVIQSWRGQQSLADASRQGYQGILSAGYYLDLMQSAAEHYAVDPLQASPPGTSVKPEELDEKIKAYEKLKADLASLTPEERARILGGEGAMWEELATSENFDAKLWPRLAVIAERLWSPESVRDLTSMYRRLAVEDIRLETLGLRHRSSLVFMRARLAGAMPAKPLDIFASVLEPVKGYDRHSENYNILSPFNRLVDTIQAESNPAREFRESVDAYLAGSKDDIHGEALRREMQLWLENVAAVRPTLEHNSLLRETLPLADSLTQLCEIGIGAIDIRSGQTNSANYNSAEVLAKVKSGSEPQADMLIQITPGIRKLVEAAAQGSH